MHNSTRKLVLQGADGVAFIADSQLNKRDENRQSWLNMYQNLKQNNITPKDFPVVIQFNKRDLPGIIPDQELAKMETASKDPVFSAVAIELAGVHDTFMGLISLLWDSLNRRYDFHRKFKMEKQQFLTDIDQIFKNNKPSSN